MTDLDDVAELIATVEGRGLTLRLGEDGQPRLAGPNEEKTDALLGALRVYREEIITRLKALEPTPKDRRPIECRWANGYTGRHHDKGWPVGAREWRPIGSEEWQPIPENELRRSEFPKASREENAGTWTM